MGETQTGPLHVQPAPQAPQAQEGPEYLTIEQACRLGRFCRATFYSLLAKQQSGLGRVAIRIPGMGHIRIPARRFREWLESVPAFRPGRKPKERKPLDLPARGGK